MANVLDQAQNFSGGVVSAARLRDRWARKEANATNEETRAQYREAIADLTARFPDLEEVPVGGAEAFARERGHGRGSRSPVHEGRRRQRAGSGKPRTSEPSSKPKAKAPPKSRGSSKRSSTSRRPRASRSSPTPRVDRAIAQTGIPEATGSAGSVVMAALGGTVAVALLFLVLNSSESPGTGAAGFPTLVNGIVRGAHRFIGLGDLFGEGVQAKGAAAVQSSLQAGRLRHQPGNLRPGYGIRPGQLGIHNKEGKR